MHMGDISSDEIKDFLIQGEGARIEFKTRFATENIIARQISAFANSGGGIIIFGVDSNGKAVGLTPEEERQALRRLRNLSASLLPPYAFDLGSTHLDGKPLVYLRIREASPIDKPIRLTTGDALVMRDSVLVKLEESPQSVIPSRKIKVFVAMSFRDQEDAALVDYFEAMKRATKTIGLPIELVRIDLVEGDYEISQKIMDEIDGADIVITDFTLNPANVYFELGYARGSKRRVIQTARKGTLLEFDPHHWRTIFYRNATELESMLGSALKTAYAEVVKS
jgi:hypothetical protein